MDDQSLLEQLQHILLKEERAYARQIDGKVSDIEDNVSQLQDDVSGIKEDMSELRGQLDDDEAWESKVDPLFNVRIEQLKRDFHHVFGYEVKETIKEEIANSKDEFVEALFPIIGQMVGRYVRYQFDSFLESFSQTVNNAFSFRGWVARMKSAITGVPLEQTLFRDALLSRTRVDEVFIIQGESGLLLGSYSPNKSTDMDMIAGMLSAIKAFVNETFRSQGENAELDAIEYGEQKILMNNFHKYYIATVVSGMADTTYKSNLSDVLMEFAQKKMPSAKLLEQVDDVLFKSISKDLREVFLDFEKQTDK